MNCPKCGYENTDSSAYCNLCNEVLDKKTVPGNTAITVNTHNSNNNVEFKPKEVEIPKEITTGSLNFLIIRLKALIAALVDMQTAQKDAEETIDAILHLTPHIRKFKASLKFEKAVSKYEETLIEHGINSALLSHIISKRRTELTEKSYSLDLNYIMKLEKRLGINTQENLKDSDIFDKFRIILTKITNLDEIEVIVRKVKLKFVSQSGGTSRLKKDEIVRYFVTEADFEERQTVTELLLNNTLTNALGANVVTEEKLSSELIKIKGNFGALEDNILAILNKEMNKITSILGQGSPIKIRILSNYIINPFADAAGAVGIFILIAYTLGRFAVALMWSLFPPVAEIFEATFIPTVSSMLDPQLVYIAGFSLLFVGGGLKMVDEKIKQKIVREYILKK